MKGDVNAKINGLVSEKIRVTSAGVIETRIWDRSRRNQPEY